MPWVIDLSVTFASVSLPSVLLNIHGPYCCRITKAASASGAEHIRGLVHDVNKKKMQERCIDESLKAGGA